MAAKEKTYEERASSTGATQNAPTAADSMNGSLDSIDSGFLREESKTIYAKRKDTSVNLQSFDFIKVIGRGSFGKVFLVKLKGTSEYYAMKSLRKDVIIDYEQVESTKLE